MGGGFRAADSYHIAGVIPSNIQYDNLFQSKLISVLGVSGLYIHTKFYQGMSTMSDLVVDFSHVRGWFLVNKITNLKYPHGEGYANSNDYLTVLDSK